MLESLALLAAGAAIGLLGTLIGAGGGFLLLPLLLIFFPDVNPSSLTAVSLFVVFLNAASGSYAYGRMKRIDYRSGLLFAAATIPGAVLGAVSTSRVPRNLFDFIFGVLLIAVSIYLFASPGGRVRASHSNPGHTHREMIDAKGERYEFSFNSWVGVGISATVGFVSSFLGIGGGIIHVPALTHLLDFPVHIATATSHFVLSISALIGTLTHLVVAHEKFQWGLALPIGVGAIGGAQFGAILSSRVHGIGIIRTLAIALGLAGCRILYMSVR